MIKTMERVGEVPQIHYEVAHHFSCPIYSMQRPDFLEAVTTVSEEYLAVARKNQTLNDLYPVHMTENYFNEGRIRAFAEFVSGTAWNILNEQGYAMQDNVVSFMEMWSQEHYLHSAMDQHVHGYGSQITGFYFLETPENCSRVIFHDPRAGKVQIDLPEYEMANATTASKMINFEPKPGMLIFANSWLAHSFTRHSADKPIKFVHFNLGVIQNPAALSSSNVEVV